MADGIANFLMLVVTDDIVTLLVVNHLDVIGRCFFHVVDYGHFNIWLMILPLWQMEWPHFLLSLWQMEKPHYEITDDVVTVADGKATGMAGVVAIVADGIATLLNGQCYSQCGRWNSHICDS